MYLQEVEALLRKAAKSQLKAIRQAGEAIAASIVRGGILHVFGVGHSHMLAEEAFFRAGGLAAVNAILEPGLMLHEGALKSTKLESLTGYAEILLDYYQVEKNDILLIVSNSGVNTVPVEMAMEAKKRGIFTVGITSVRYSKKVKGQRQSLSEIVDIVIDNQGEPGDALLELPSLPQRVGPSSTVVGAALVNAVIVEAIEALQTMGVEPPVYLSSHLPGAKEHNMRLARQYKTRIKAL